MIGSMVRAALPRLRTMRVRHAMRSFRPLVAAVVLLACAAHPKPPPPAAPDPDVERWKRDAAIVRSPTSESDRTHLQGKQYTFARYFGELKRKVSDHWHPDVVYRTIDPTRSVYGLRDRLTVLRLTLKPDGSLVAVTIERPSGIDKIDEEGVAAVKAAQPFEPPPAPLVKDGVASFRFGFLFEVSGGAAALRSIGTDARPEGKEPIGAPP